MELLQQLTRDQYEQFQNLKSTLPSDSKTDELCLNYYISYKQQTGYVNADKLQIALKCAFFMAQKSQTICDMKGQKVKGISLSLNQLLKSHKLDDIMIMLKDFCKKVKIADQQAQNDLNGIVKEISFLITFHSKFQKTMQKLQLKQKVDQSFGYTKIFNSFVWLLYVQAKNKVLHRSLELIENTCMLAHTIAFMIIYSWQYLKPLSFLKGDKKLNQDSSWKQVCLIVKQKVLQIFLIKNVQTYKVIAKSFQDYFSNLISSQIIKISAGKFDFLSPQLINTNYKRFDHYYQKTISPENLDQRIFFKDRATNLTPSKFTPFSRQGYANKLSKHKFGNLPQQKQNFTSHRILNYDLIQKQQLNQKTIPISQMKLPRTVMQSPSTVKVPLICSTPITTGMEMYNYLTQKAKKSQGKLIDSSIQPILNRIFDRQKKDSQKNTRNLKNGLICSLHKYILDQYIKTHPQESGQKISHSFLALSIQLVFFVSNISMSFQQIQTQLNIDILEEWKACDFLLKFDKAMPSTLKLHLLDLQSNIVSRKVWMDNILIQKLSNYANGQQVQQSIQRCFRRILHQIAYQVTQLSQALRLDQRMSEGVFDLMKQILVNHTYLLQNRHVDQMLICSIYVNCRVNQLDVKFNDIKDKYQDINHHNKQIHQQLIFKVYMDGIPPVDIIKFYNSVFIVNLKGYMSSIKEKGGHNSGAYRKNFLLQSPLKTIMPNELNFRQKKQSKPNITPQTHLLYAYNESPILKYEFNNLKGPVNSKKVINFQEEQQNLSKKYLEQEQKNDSLNNANTNQFLSRNFNKKIEKQLMTPIQTPMSHSQIYQTQANSPTLINNIIPKRLTPTRCEIPSNCFRVDAQVNKYKHTKNPSTGNFISSYDRR